MYLLDTNVISELRRRGRADRRGLAWATATPHAATLPFVVAILEVERGILSVERRDANQAGIVRHWLETRLLPDFGERILPIDVAVARRCATLHVPDPRPERNALIGATAIVHGLTVVTRNIRDFEAMGVPVVNPWVGAGEK